MILAMARHSDTEEEIVVYQDATHPEKIWVRSLPIFMEEVEWEGRKIPRFRLHKS